MLEQKPTDARQHDLCGAWVARTRQNGQVFMFPKCRPAGNAGTQTLAHSAMSLHFQQGSDSQCPVYVLHRWVLLVWFMGTQADTAHTSAWVHLGGGECNGLPPPFGWESFWANLNSLELLASFSDGFSRGGLGLRY